MTDAELKRLSRTELLEMPLELEQENDQLRRENDELRKKMQAREIMLTEADSIAEASSAFTAPARSPEGVTTGPTHEAPEKPQIESDPRAREYAPIEVDFDALLEINPDIQGWKRIRRPTMS